MITRFKIFENFLDEIGDDVSVGCIVTNIDGDGTLRQIYEMFNFFKENDIDFKLFFNPKDSYLNIIFSRSDTEKVDSEYQHHHITFMRNFKNFLEIKEEDLESILQANKYNL